MSGARLSRNDQRRGAKDAEANQPQENRETFGAAPFLRFLTGLPGTRFPPLEYSPCSSARIAAGLAGRNVVAQTGYTPGARRSLSERIGFSKRCQLTAARRMTVANFRQPSVT